MNKYFTAIFCLCVIRIETRSSFPTFELNLDLPANERYTKLLTHFNDTLHIVFNEVMDHKFDGLLKKIAKPFSELRGKEKDPEFASEIQAFVDITKLPYDDIHTLQMFYELTGLMIPIENLTKIDSFAQIIGEKWSKRLKLDTIDFTKMTQEQVKSTIGFLERKFCTGIIALNEDDGMVYHARNFDNSIYLAPIQYIANFTRGGREVFLATQIAGYAGVFTGFKRGAYAIEFNTRFPDHIMGNEQMLDNLLIKKTPLATWQARL